MKQHGNNDKNRRDCYIQSHSFLKKYKDILKKKENERLLINSELSHIRTEMHAKRNAIRNARRIKDA